MNDEKTAACSYYALSLLTFVYVLNFLDRQIIYILFPSIKADLAFSDFQLAMLGGTSFAIFNTILGVPFGKIADKHSRTKLIAFGLVVWSLFTGLTGFSNGFWAIFFCRVMVGIGEATLGPAAISLLADYFPPTKHATVSSIYAMGIVIGAALAAMLGGALSPLGWRSAFFIIGFPGIVFSILVFALREPKRRTNSVEGTGYSSEDWKKLVLNKSFVMLCLGYSFFGLAGNNIIFWGTTYFQRVYEIPLQKTGFWLGILMLTAGIPATLFGGMMADWRRKKSPGGRMYFGAAFSTISLLFWVLILFSDDFYLIIPAGFILLFSAIVWFGAAVADATEISGANLRGLAVAIFFLVVNLFSYVFGANLIGKLNDILGTAENPQMMRYALLVCPISCAIGAIFLSLGGNSMERSN
jgi:MFS family permease